MNTENPIKVEYNGTEITYNEANARWEFTLRNRDRYAETLTKAREAIDKPVPEKAKPFERVQCWYEGYDGWEKVMVTSVAERRWGDQYKLWVMDSKKNRSKQWNTSLFPCGPCNNEVVAAISTLKTQINELTDKRDKLKNHMTHLHVQEEES